MMSSPAGCNFSWLLGNLKIIAESRKVHILELRSGQKSIDCYLKWQMLTSHDFSHPGTKFSWLFSIAFQEGSRFNSRCRYTFVSHQKILERQSFDHCRGAKTPEQAIKLKSLHAVRIRAQTDQRNPWNQSWNILWPNLKVLKMRRKRQIWLWNKKCCMCKRIKEAPDIKIEKLVAQT